MQIWRWFAAGFGSGWLPAAPGTWGSLAAAVVAWGIWQLAGVPGLLLAVGLLALLASLACRRVIVDCKSADPAWIVVDEWLGQWLCLLLVAMVRPLDIAWLVAAFLIFRVFDIWKPWPVSAAERMRPAWLAILADDVVAGLMAAGVLVVAGIWLP